MVRQGWVIGHTDQVNQAKQEQIKELIPPAGWRRAIPSPRPARPGQMAVNRNLPDGIIVNPYG